MPRFTDIGSYVTGIPGPDARGYLVLSIDELAERKVPHCVIIAWEDGRFLNSTQKGWLLADVVQTQDLPDQPVLFIGTYGQYLTKTLSGERNERLTGPGIDISNRGPLRCARLIAGSVYAVGADRQVYQQTTEGSWRRLDNEQSAPPPDTATSFECVDGYSADEIYTVGMRGEIWQYSHGWKQVSSPANRPLSAVCCAGDGRVYAAGAQGLLLHGRGESWETMDLGQFRGNFQALCWFKGDLYLATLDCVYRLNGCQLEPMDWPVETAGKLSCTDRVLWSIGAKDVVAFDGHGWHRID